MSNILVPETYRFRNLIKISKIILDQNEDISWSDIGKVKNIIYRLLNEEKLSPNDIKRKYNIQYSDFGMFIKNSLGLELRSLSNAVKNYYIQHNKHKTSEKALYKDQCQFQFNPYQYKNILGYNLLLSNGLFHPINRPNGMCRDHIISIEYGWRNKIPPSIISHPANCQFLTNVDNIKKGSGCSFSLKQLMERITPWNNGTLSDTILKSYKQLSKTNDHKRKISESISKYKRITNGSKNKYILKTTPIPEGYWIGLTRHN